MNPTTRRQIYVLLIIIAVGMALGRIVSAQRVYEPANSTQRWPAVRPAAAPTFGANDRSRWDTVRALVDNGTYAIGTRDRNLIVFSAVALVGPGSPVEAVVAARVGYQIRIASKPGHLGAAENATFGNRGIMFEDGWDTIDCVLHPTRLEFYSSKPPLLATLMAGLYWLLKHITGWTLAANYLAVVRTLLLVIHPLPFFLYLLALSRLVERYGRTDWGRLFVLAAGCFATLLTPFLITFNNHTLGAFSAMFTLWAVLAIWERCASPERERRVWHLYLLAGFFAAFTVTNELPALAFACAVGVLLLTWSPLRTLCLFLPAAGVVAVGFFVTNYAAVGQWSPAYGETDTVWYKYEGSYWKQIKGHERKSIDFARERETPTIYRLNLLIGHHGFFSLTPIWLLGLTGMIAGLAGFSRWPPIARLTGLSPPLTQEDRALTGEVPPAVEPHLPWFVPPLAFIVSVVVIGFYLTENRGRNYGGITNGPRWFMWLAPLFLLGLLPVADWLAPRRWGRALGLVLLALSILSASYAAWNPWHHPWLYDLFEWLKWVSYYG